MAIESAVFGLLLFGLCLVLGQCLTQVDRYLAAVEPGAQAALSWPAAPATPEPTAVQIIGFLGAGIYEETLFRLLLYSALVALFTLADFPPPVSALLAA